MSITQTKNSNNISNKNTKKTRSIRTFDVSSWDSLTEFIIMRLFLYVYTIYNSNTEAIYNVTNTFKKVKSQYFTYN